MHRKNDDFRCCGKVITCYNHDNFSGESTEKHHVMKRNNGRVITVRIVNFSDQEARNTSEPNIELVCCQSLNYKARGFPKKAGNIKICYCKCDLRCLSK